MENKSSPRKRPDSDVEKGANYNTALKIVICLLAIVGCKSLPTQQSSVSLLEINVSNQKYSTGNVAKFRKESDQLTLAAFNKKFSKSKEIVLIKEYCNPYVILGSIHSSGSNNRVYFSRKQKNSALSIDTTVNVIVKPFHEKIIQLLQQDSLSYYEKLSNSAPPADDDLCFLSIELCRIKDGKYQETKYSIHNIFAFRKMVIPE